LLLPILLSTVTSPLVGAGGDQFDRAATKCFSQLITLFAATPHTLPVALIPSPSLLAFIANTIVSTGVCRLAIGVPLRSLLLHGRLHNTPGNRKKTSCDEYPFNSTEQGGESNYPLGVSLKLVPKEEATPQGSLMNIGIKPRLGIVIGDEEKKWYGVVPLFSLSTTSFWRNTNGDIIF
jgi:hypothetical protein